jgi:branched-subunit amino acid transport protein
LVSELLAIVLLAGALTYLTRLSFIALLASREIPMFVLRALHLVAPAVLSAMVFPALLMPQGEIEFGLHNARLLAGIAAIAVAWYTKAVVPTIVLGMLALWGLQAFSG